MKGGGVPRWEVKCFKAILVTHVERIVSGVFCVLRHMKSAALTLESQPFSPPLQYGIVIDSGSSRSNVYVYLWPGEKQNETGVVREIMNCRVAGESRSFGGESRTKVPSHWPRRQKVPVCLICMCLEAAAFSKNTQSHKGNTQTLRREAWVKSQAVAAPAVAPKLRETVLK